MPDSSIAIIFVIIEQQLNNKASWALYILSAANITDANSTEGSAGKKKKKSHHCFQLIGFNPEKNTYFIETSSDDSVYIEEEGEITEENMGAVPNYCHYTDVKLKLWANRLLWSV